MVRGGAPLAGSLLLQNTGAGHHIPSGSPFSGLDISLLLVIEGESSWQQEVARWSLARTVERKAPYRTTEDTRLAAGEQRTLEFGIPVPQDAPSGSMSLQLLLTRTIAGSPTGSPRTLQAVPLSLD